MNKYLKTNTLYEDPNFIFINKTPGLLSISDRFDSKKAHIKGILLTEYEEIFPLHRLDQYTSGVMVFAKNAEAHKKCSELFEARKITKEYAALCLNRPEQDKGIIDTPIAENNTKRGTYTLSDRGKQATTEYEVIGTWPNYSLLKLSIKTGRTHQIRVHLSYKGCPLLVDPVYGYYSEYYLSAIKRKKVNLKKGEKEKPLLTRTPLHATLLSFRNPIDGKILEVRSELPKDIKAVCYQLDKRYGGEVVEARQS